MLGNASPFFISGDDLLNVRYDLEEPFVICLHRSSNIEGKSPPLSRGMNVRDVKEPPRRAGVLRLIWAVFSCCRARVIRHMSRGSFTFCDPLCVAKDNHVAKHLPALLIEAWLC